MRVSNPALLLSLPLLKAQQVLSATMPRCCQSTCLLAIEVGSAGMGHLEQHTLLSPPSPYSRACVQAFPRGDMAAGKEAPCGPFLWTSGAERRIFCRL